MSGKLTLKLTLVIALTLTVGVGMVFAFTAPTQNPPGGDTVFWRLNGSTIYYNAGNVGIGNSSPTYMFEADGGNAYASGAVRGGTGLCIGSSCKTSWSNTIPSGMVLFFDLSSCPSGWTATSTVQGRYIVGLPSAGTLGATVGTALSDKENRPVGQHTHTITDPGHNTTVDTLPGAGIGGNNINAGSNIGTNYPNGTTPSALTGITINNAGSVPGTNGPYIQLLVCQKD